MQFLSRDSSNQQPFVVVINKHLYVWSDQTGYKSTRSSYFLYRFNFPLLKKKGGGTQLIVFLIENQQIIRKFMSGFSEHLRGLHHIGKQAWYNVISQYHFSSKTIFFFKWKLSRELNARVKSGLYRKIQISAPFLLFVRLSSLAQLSFDFHHKEQ